VIVDQRATYDRVVDVVETARGAGYSSLSFVFLGPKNPNVPPPSKIDARFDALLKRGNEGGANIMPEVQQLVADVIGTCPALKTHYAEMEKAPDQRKALLDGTPAAVLACDCNVDIPSLQVVLFRMLGTHTTLRTLTVDISDDATPITAVAGASWEEVAKQLDPKEKRVRFALR
jgi:hypothetical protein